jgi:hypothetical protein
VAHVLPRHWDGRRLLHFFAGLAMLALAWIAPAALEASPPVPAVITASAQSGVVLETALEIPADISADISARIEQPMPATPVAVPLIIVAAAILVPPGLALRVRAERAPPAF